MKYSQLRSSKFFLEPATEVAVNKKMRVTAKTSTSSVESFIRRLRASARFKKILIAGILLFCFIGSSFSWTITKDLVKEIKAKKAFLSQNQSDPNAYFDLAITYAYSNYIQEGWALLKKADQADPTFKNRAYKIYAQKVADNPNDWKMRFRYGFALYFAGKKLDAIRQLRIVLDQDPYNVWAYGYIALIYGEMDETDKAIQYAEAGLKVDPLVAALHLLLSQGYYKKGDSGKGLFEATNAVRLKVQGY